jgi:hypothetical protein
MQTVGRLLTQLSKSKRRIQMDFLNNLFGKKPIGQKTKNGKDTTGNMAKCDICMRTITEKERYLLSTKEVTASTESWKRWLSKANLPKLMTDGTSVNFVTLFFPPTTYIPIPEAKTSLLLFLVAKRASSDTPWLICKDCSHMFSFDHSAAKAYAVRWATTGEPSNGFALCKVSQEGRTAIIEAIDSEAFQTATNAALKAVK